MFKNTRSLIMPLSLFFFLGSAYSATAQVKKQLTAAEIKQWDNKTGNEDGLAKIPAAKKEQAAAHARILLAYTMKHLLHNADPAKYPVDDKPNSTEADVSAALKKLSPANLKKMSQRAVSNLSDPSKITALGKLKAIDFTKKAIQSEITRLMPGESLKVFKKSDMPKVHRADELPDVKISSKLELALNSIYCADQTNPEASVDDDMVLGGVIIGCSGNVKAVPSVVSCKFKDNDLCDHGGTTFGTYDMTSCTDYPKTFTGIFKLVEADPDMQEVADFMSQVTQLVAGQCHDLKDSYDLQYIVAMVASTMDALALLYTYNSEDYFPSRIVFFTLDSAGGLGADGESGDLATTNISAHGGVYRIGFKWRKK